MPGTDHIEPPASSLEAGMVTLVRLKRRADFLRVASTRRKWVTPSLILQAAPTPPAKAMPQQPYSELSSSPEESLPESEARTPITAQPQARVGFTVSKKVGNAVKRNRARRRLRAAVDEVFPLNAADGVDYVVIGRTSTVDYPYQDLLRELRLAARRVLTAKPSGDKQRPASRRDRRIVSRDSKSRASKARDAKGASENKAPGDDS